jgi:hypothetical protein
MRELTHPVELRDDELDLVAAGGGSLIDVDVDISKSFNNILNNNNVAVGVGSVIGQKQ